MQKLFPTGKAVCTHVESMDALSRGLGAVEVTDLNWVQFGRELGIGNLDDSPPDGGNHEG